MSKTIEKERIAFSIDEKLKNAIERYCKDIDSSMSSYIKSLIGNDLIEKGYIKKGGKE